MTPAGDEAQVGGIVGDFPPANGQPLADVICDRVREMLIAGDFGPGEKLLEQQVAAQFGISRNTLREVFRLLTSQGLLVHYPNRGVFVAAPGAAAVVDIYRMRRVIQQGAVQAAIPGHPALVRMKELARRAKEQAADGDWRAVGTLNMEFHRAMVELCDSPRLSAAFGLLLAELRLVFGRIRETAVLHTPYIETNGVLVDLLEQGRLAAAADELDGYLLKSERSILAALQRLKS